MPALSLVVSADLYKDIYQYSVEATLVIKVYGSVTVQIRAPNLDLLW